MKVAFILSIIAIVISITLLWNSASPLNLQDQKIIDNISQKTQTQNNKHIDQYPTINEPHWGHMPLTYHIKSTCNERLANLSRAGFNKIQEETSQIVQYQEVNTTQADIIVTCEEKKGAATSGELTLGNAQTSKSAANPNLIKSAVITIFNQGMTCATGYPALEVHEILHTLGFEHSPLVKSIMSPYSADSSRQCQTTKIDAAYITCLQYIYTNASTSQDCSEVHKNTITKGTPDEVIYECPNGTYPIEGTVYCCPEPGMKLTEDKHCTH